VYGLGSSPDIVALDRLASLKGRPAGKPFLLLVDGLEMLEAVGLVLGPSARVLAREFWPGPLTLVLRGGEGKLPDRLRGPEGGIAVRWTSHRGIARLLHFVRRPLTSTSANHPGQAAAPGAEAIEQFFPESIDAGELLVLDGGTLGNVPPSTLVDCTGAAPRMVREGAIPRHELRRRAGSMAP
jgi:L-threonylcarbamoyladenylate synthase